MPAPMGPAYALWQIIKVTKANTLKFMFRNVSIFFFEFFWKDVGLTTELFLTEMDS